MHLNGAAQASGSGAEQERSFHDLRQSLAAMAPELFGRALRMSRSAWMAEDLVQDTVERAIRFEAHYTPGTNLRAWVHQILFSVFVTKCRRNRRERKQCKSNQSQSDRPFYSTDPYVERNLPGSGRGLFEPQDDHGERLHCENLKFPRI